jgi:hypothetical protein
VISRNGEALAKIEAVGILPLNAGVEVDLRAPMGARLVPEPLDERAAVAGGSGVLVGHEIVDVQ